MRFRDAFKVLETVGRVAADVAMTQPGIRRRVERVQGRVETLRQEFETIMAEAEARAEALLRELQAEAMRARKQLERQRTAADHYRTLGLAEGAGLDEVKKAYRKLMRQHHPDKHSTDPHAEARAAERAKVINEAYRELTALLTGRESRAAT